MDANTLVRDLIGKPFMYGGRGPDYYDCYGLVRELLRRTGRAAPDYRSPTEGAAIIALMTSSAATHWREVPCRPGVVAMFALPRQMHVGFVLDGHSFVHAWEKSGGVCVERLAHWRKRLVACYDIA